MTFGKTVDTLWGGSLSNSPYSSFKDQQYESDPFGSS